MKYLRTASPTAPAALAVCLLLALVEGIAAEPRPPLSKESSYSEATVVVFNRTSTHGEALAHYYAAARQIPVRNLIGITCPTTEIITRQQYATTIEQPLRETLLQEGWWLPERDKDTGEQNLRSQFHILVLIQGIPLRILDAPGRGRGASPIEREAASVDSELTALGRPGSPLKGPLANPYYNRDQPFHEAQIPIQLVGRIDAPTTDLCRTMIDDAIRAEMEGLWGQAYVDLDDRHPVGNDWLKEAATEWRKLGIPLIVNRQAGTFPSNYPMRDPILYFGWYQEHVDGPFLNPAFKFRPGAVACHIHSLNARTLRSSKEHWAGPLLARGATAVLGTVDEPYLQLSHHLGIFSNRLAKGYTLVESAYMATEALSWMNVVVGDPLYRPFASPDDPLNEDQFKKDRWLPYKVLRLAYERWGNEAPLPVPELFFKLELACAKVDAPELIEHLALAAVEQGDYEEGRTQFLRAKGAYPDARDKLRMDLHIGDLDWRLEDRLDAMKTYRAAAEEFADLSESRAAREMMERVTKSARQ